MLKGLKEDGRFESGLPTVLKSINAQFGRDEYRVRREGTDKPTRRY